MLKTLTLLTALSTISLVSAQDTKAIKTITCAKVKRKHKTSYPMDKAAFELAKDLGVKTCTLGREIGKLERRGKLVIKTVIIGKTKVELLRDKFDDYIDGVE